jgi:hypothetical protein
MIDKEINDFKVINDFKIPNRKTAAHTQITNHHVWLILKDISNKVAISHIPYLYLKVPLFKEISSLKKKYTVPVLGIEIPEIRQNSAEFQYRVPALYDLNINNLKC